MESVFGRTCRGAASAALLSLALALSFRAAHAQNPTRPAPDASAQPVSLVVDTVLVRGSARLSEAVVRASSGLRPGGAVDAGEVQRVIHRMMGTGNFDHVAVSIRPTAAGHTAVVLDVTERPFITAIEFRGLRSLAGKTVRDTVKLRENAPLDPARVAAARKMIRDLLAKKGIQLVSVDTALVAVPGEEHSFRLVFNVREGNLLAIADIDFEGNAHFSDAALRAAMKTRKEGFWWFRAGKFDRETFDTDLRTSLPDFYGSHGYIDFAVEGDTLVVDPETGKARLVVRVSEGPQYRLGEFRVVGNSRFPTDDLSKLFTVQHRSVLGLPFGGTSEREQGEVFDRAALDDATRQVQQMYKNEGYLFADVEPVVDRVPAAAGAEPTVNVTWAISEKSPFYIRRISFVGNTNTHERVMRDRIWVLPGDVYNEDALIQSYQALTGLGFFETPMTQPEILPEPDSGVVDIVFHVKEKNTGNVNFGTVIGGGYGGRGGGFSGFLGYSQPNLFGQGKNASVRVEYGAGRSTLELSYSDPALFGTRNSGSISLYSTGDRYSSFDNGRRTRTGGELQFGIPVPGLLRTRAFVGYSLSRTHFTNLDDLGCTAGDDLNIFCQPDATASTLSMGITRDTKNHPLFPTSGTRQALSLGQTGGPLGGSGNYQKVTGETEWWVPIGHIGSGARPLRLTMGLKANGGAIFGDVRLFPFETFYVGGVQFGQPLRGYKERTITPAGYSAACETQFTRACLGNAYMTLTAETALRVSDALSLSVFTDAGNNWANVRQVDPTRLFRSAGFGATVVTPFLGAIGIDVGYGFDLPKPAWQIHFKLGQGF
ncbi:MAG: outer membrane protein assembly complex, YaeT protein [Gemmatimonadetes bacterium]|nr:outer membrane protein assembly complex, YaeT protein [Gemmatimonadota bacterium]